jgi:hypothetical protein
LDRAAPEEIQHMVSRILVLTGALMLPALPAAAQSKPLGSPAVMTVKRTEVKAKTVDAKTVSLTRTDSLGSESKGRGQLPLGEKVALNNTLKTRLQGLLTGSGLTYDQATTGWKNQGQLVAAMNVAQEKNLSFASIYTGVVTDGKYFVDVVAELRGAQVQ